MTGVQTCALPISNILLYASLLEESVPPEQRGQAAAVREQAEKLSFLLSALVKGSRLEAGMIALAPRVRPVEPLLEETAAALSAAAERRGVRLRLDTTGATACFDSRWTAVTLSAAAGELFCRIDVADTGPGIPEEERPLVFQRFYRGKGCREAEGSGLGLYLAREIALAQGGYAQVRCPRDGGSVFSLYLPRTGEGKPAAPPPAPPTVG